MKFSLKSSFTNIRKEIQAIFGNIKINSFDDSKCGVSKAGLEEDVFIKDVPTVKEKCNSEMNDEFTMILNTLNEKMVDKLTMSDFDLSDISKYQHLIVSGSYQTTYDFESYIDMQQYKEQEENKEYKTIINIYYRPLAKNYLIEYYKCHCIYPDKSTYTKVFNFSKLMDYLLINVDPEFRYESIEM